MNTQHKAKLCLAIEKFLAAINSGEEYNSLVTPHLVDHMADAAESVFDAAVEMSVFSDEQKEDS